MGKAGINEPYKFHVGSSSIPTKYQTVPVKNTEKKGFTSQSKRFTDRLNETPGPGSYQSHSSVDTCSPSFSKKGTGSFASKSLRVARNHQRVMPGPDTYNLQSSLLHQHNFCRGPSRNFCSPMIDANKTDIALQKTPAPNQYNVSYSGVQVNSVVSAESAFLSKTIRNAILTPKFRGPSPCHYTVNDTMVQKNPKVPFSCFKSTSARIQPVVDNEAPGPGAYNPYQAPEPVTKTVISYGRRFYLGLSAPPLIPPSDPPLPGPGHYDIVSCNPPSKLTVSSAAFISGTSRWTQDTRGQDIPGPGHYDPDMPSKHSFIYNHAKTWIPA